MADPLLYVSQADIAGEHAPSLTTVQPAALPPSGGLEKIGESIAGFGAAAEHVNEAIRVGKQHTQVAVATTNFLTKLDELEQRYAKDPDFDHAFENFTNERRTLETEASGGIDDPQLRTTSMLQWRRAGIVAGKRVNNAALSREADINVAALDAQGQEALKSAAAAASPIERQSVIDFHLTKIHDAATANWISAQQAVARGQQFRRSLAVADITRDMRLDPARAKELLEDPNNYPGLDPVTRENFKNNAANTSDQVKIDQLGVQAQGDPAGARKAVEGAGLQPHNFYRALATIDQVEQQHQALLDRAARETAATARSTDDVKQLVKDGYDVDPVRIENVRNANVAAAARGDPTAAQYVRELDLIAGLAPHVRAAWSMPIGILDASVKKMEADMLVPGANVAPSQVTSYKAFKAVRDEIYAKRDSEPIVLGGENGARYYQLAPIDTAAAPNDENLQRELAARSAHAATAQQTYGGTANALTAEETRGFKDRWAQAHPDDQFRLLRTFGGTLTGRAYEDTVAAIAGNDPLAVFVGRTAQARPELAREILQGMALLGDSRTKEKSANVRETLRSKIGGALYPEPAMQETAISAALALDAARRGARGALYDPSDTTGLDKAVDDVTGAIVKRNGQRIPITPGIPARYFLGVLDGLTTDDLKLMGGAKDRNGRDMDPRTLGDYGLLKPLSIGGKLYAVGMRSATARDGFAPVLTSDGSPLVFDMVVLAPRHTSAIGGTSYAEGRRLFREGQFERLRQARIEGSTPPPGAVPEPPPAPEPSSPTMPVLEGE